MVTFSHGNISTHAPLAGRDFSGLFISSTEADFNPRAPCGARPVVFGMVVKNNDFNPRAPCGARRSAMVACHSLKVFQPTRPLRGATLPLFIHILLLFVFQPTRPLRGATMILISSATRWSYFNPRAPCGARQQKCTNHYAHFCDNRQISDAFAQNAACQGILLLFDAGKSCGFWVRTAQVISAHLCFAL